MRQRANDRALRAAFQATHSALARELKRPDRWMPDITDESTRRIAELFSPRNHQSERRSIQMGMR